MKKKFLLLLPALLLTACGDLPGPEFDTGTYAFFMWNYPRMDVETPNGYTERGDSLIYEKIEIESGQTFAKPAVDPERQNYEFQGWYKEKTCENLWDFATDTAEYSVFIYAKWGVSQGEEYVEPEYTYPETIITDANYRL